MGDTLELFANVGRSAQRRLDTNPQPGPSGIQPSGQRRALVSNDRDEETQSQETRPERKKKENASPRVPEAHLAPATTKPLTLGLNKEELKAFKTEQRRRYCSWWKNQDRVLPVWARMLTLDQLGEISNFETIVRELYDDREPTKKDFLKYYREVKSCKSPNDEVLSRPPLHRLRIYSEWRLFFVDDVRIMKKEYEKGNVEAYFFRPVDDEEQEAPDPEIAVPLPLEPIVEPQVQAAAEEAEEEEVWQPPIEEVDLERFRQDSNIVELLQNLGKEGPRLEKVISSSFNCWKEGGTTAILRQLRWTHKEEPKLQLAVVEEQPQTFELSSDSEESLLEELQRNEPIPLLPSPPKPTSAPVVSSMPPRSTLPHSRRSPAPPKRLPPPPPSRKRMEQLIDQLVFIPETNPSPPKRASSQLPTTVTVADHEKKKSPPKKKVKTKQTLLNRFIKQTPRPKPRHENDDNSKAKARETRPMSSKGTNLVEGCMEKCQNSEPAITASSQPEAAVSHQKDPEKTQNNHQTDTLPATTPTSSLESTVEPEVAPPQQQSMEPDEEAVLTKLHSSQGQDATADPNIYESFKSVESMETHPVNADRPDLVKETLEGSQNVTPDVYGSPQPETASSHQDEPTKNQSHQTEKPSTTTTAFESATESDITPPQQQQMETDEVEEALAELHSSQDQSAIADPPNTHDSSENGTSSHVTVIETPPSVEETPVQIKVEPDQQHSPYNDSVEVVEVPAPEPIVILDETTANSQELFANMGTGQPQINALAKADQRFLQQSFTRAIQTLQQTLIETSSETESGDQSTPLKENTEVGVIETSVESEASPNIQVAAKKPQEGSKPRLARPILTEFLNRWNGKETIGDENVPIESASFSEKF